MFDDNFIAKFVTGGTLHLWKGYSIQFHSDSDTWSLVTPSGEELMEGTIDECAEYYVEHNLAAR